jgi:S1-C subfamily serine protease
MRTGKWKVWMAALVAVMMMAAGTSAAEPVGPKLQAASVNIKAGSAQGSGSVILRSVDGQPTPFVLTAAHVVDGLRKENKHLDRDGKQVTNISYNDAQIVQEVATVDNSRIVGDTRLDAKVLCVDYVRDIALLQVRAQGNLKTSVVFLVDRKSVPPAGTKIYHCGAPGGQDIGGSATLTSGIISRTGVRIPDMGGGSDKGIFDQTDTAALGGSSGGMICLETDGQWIGMITLGLRGGDNFHWFVPVRAVARFVDDAKLPWLMDPAGTVGEKELKDVPLEVSPPNSPSGYSTQPEGFHDAAFAHMFR